MSAQPVVEAVLVAGAPDLLVSARRRTIEVDFAGVVGDRHYGVTAPASSREARFYGRGTEIRNRRQVSLVSVEECAEIARRMGVPQVSPEDLGANVLVAGCEPLSSLALGTRLLFPSGAGLVCEAVNQPCRLPGQVIANRYPETPGLVRGFLRAAYGRRGIVASVERPGRICQGDWMRLVPPQRAQRTPSPRGSAVAVTP